MCIIMAHWFVHKAFHYSKPVKMAVVVLQFTYLFTLLVLSRWKPLHRQGYKVATHSRIAIVSINKRVQQLKHQNFFISKICPYKQYTLNIPNFI